MNTTTQPETADASQNRANQNAAVVTYSSPMGTTINITPAQEAALTALGKWPRDSRGQEYCQVSRGLGPRGQCERDRMTIAALFAESITEEQLSESCAYDATLDYPERTLPQRPQEFTIIDDGQFRFPVLTAELARWEGAYGPITPSNYEQFCEDVDHTMPGVLPGSAEMIAECERLSELGARVYRPA